MSVRVTDKNNIPELIDSLTGMKNRSVESGVLVSGEQAMIAFVNEFGFTVNVSERMRAYLHHQGLHLSKNTTSINIPERSFIRSGWDQNKDAVYSKIESLLGQVVELNMQPDDFLEMIGLEVKGKLQAKLVEVSSPSNHPFTIEQKNSSNPLVDTGSLSDSIDYQIK